MGSNVPGKAGLSALPPPVRPLPPPRFGNRITVLSIDGGGIRGLIPSVIVASLEEKLQNLDGPDVRIVDYFDVIAGTSTGALLTACLVTPNKEEPPRPMFTAKEIIEFYQKEGPKIFPPRKDGLLYRFGNSITMGLLYSLTGGPMYDGKHLRNTIMRMTGGLKIDEALTTVLVPAFDVQTMTPTIFYSVKNKTHVPNTTLDYDMLLSDILIGTSAAPTYFPAHRATLREDSGKITDIHLIDGGVAVNNPTMVAIWYIIKEMLCGNPDYPNHYGKIGFEDLVIISLGTGAVKHKAWGTYTAEDCAKWSALHWIYNKKNDHRPLLEILSGPSDMFVDFYATMLLQPNRYGTYLRIQTQDELEGPTALMDNATDDNMNKLIQIGQELLQKTMYRINLLTGLYEPTRQCTNEQELQRLAEILSAERKTRLRNYYRKK